MGYRCSVSTCSCNSNDDPNRRFFRFPNEIRRCKQWIKASGHPELLGLIEKGLFKTYKYFMCDLHFQPSDHLPYQLKKIAVPTLNLPPIKNENPEKCTQTDIDIDVMEEQECSSKSNKRKLPGNHPVVTKKRKTSNDSASVSPNTSSSLTGSASFVQLLRLIYFQKKLHSQIKSGMETINLFALKVCMTIPHSYTAIKELLDLPEEKNLVKEYVDIDTKLSSNALACLEMKIKYMKKVEKYCVVYAEKINVQCNLYYQINKDRIIGFHDINGTQMPEPATHAVVIIARGIFSDWEQPLTYCFLSRGKHEKELNVWLYYTLSQVLRVGLKVTAFVSGHEQMFTDVAKMWGVTVGKPYFFVNEKKVYYLFDFCKLVKSLRDKLMENNFLFHDAEGNELIAAWEDVKTVHAIDSKRQYPLAPKLTETHISPTQADKVKTEVATQVFSKPVVAAMTLSKELGQLEEKSAGTIKLIKMVNETIEILNSSLDLTVPAANSNQIEVLKDFLKFLKDVTIVEKNTNNDITNTIKCLKGLKVTLKNIIDLSHDLKLKEFKILHTHKIYQNVAQKFFDSVMVKNSKKPLPIQLSKAFNKYFVDKILKNSKKDQSSNALDKLLSMDFYSGTESFHGNVTRSLLIGTVDYRFEVPEEYSLEYVSGYLLRKCRNIHKCVHFHKYLHGSVTDAQPYYRTFVNLTAVVPPPVDFIHVIEQMDKVFIRYFQRKQLHSIGNEIKAEMEQLTFGLCCSCFPVEYLIKLFIRFRIFNVIRANKQNFLDNSFKWKCFCLYNI